MTPGQAAGVIIQIGAKEVASVKTKIDAACPRAANQLMNARLLVLAGPSPSSPGSPPGVRTGHLRRDWTMFCSVGGGSGTFGIESGADYSKYLEDGTSRMEARPFVDKIQEQALPKIKAIFEEIGG